MERHTKNLEELQGLAGQWVRELRPHADRATVVGLSGELGAGKTSFVQGVAKALGVKEHVTSPTFVLIKKYPIPKSPFLINNFSFLIHADAYRLNSGADLGPLRWKELLAEPRTLLILEWPERVRDALPDDIINLIFEVSGEGRLVSMNN